MSDTIETTPLTEMLGLYRRLSAVGSRGLTAHLDLATRFAQKPDELAERFALSVAQFARYRNPKQPFHERGAYAAIPPEAPPEIAHTVDFAALLARRRRWTVEGRPDLAFSYVDREPDCMRTSPGQKLEDGKPSKNQITADLLLRSAGDGTPIVAELKIRDDQDAFYGLVQALAAAAHLVTASQRLRLHNVYEFPPASGTGGPYVDVYVVLHDHPMKGLRPEILEKSANIASRLLENASVASLVRRIEFLHSNFVDDGLAFEPA
jgi:hypothetical protein